MSTWHHLMTDTGLGTLLAVGLLLVAVAWLINEITRPKP